MRAAEDLAARVAAGRRRQRLPAKVRDPRVLDQLAALIVATTPEGAVTGGARSAPYGQPSGGGAHGSAAA